MQAITLDFRIMNSVTVFEQTKIYDCCHGARGLLDDYIT
jgi:hypothetical protein